MNQIPTDAPVNKMTFEQSLQALETIVKQLETGRIPLEEAVAAYERGVVLKQHCEKKLSEAKLRIEKIAAGPDGTLETTPLDGE